MKKMIYSAIALVVVAVGCTKSNIVDVPEGQKTPITFDTYNGKIPVSKATEITQSNIGKIYVTGFQAEDKAVGYTSFYMNPESGLVKSGDNWTYSPLSYWPANGTLEFVAYGDNTPRIKDGTPGSLVPVNDSYAVFDYTVPTAAASQKDLIAAHVAPTESTATVVFEMKHLLSRIGFKLETVGSGTAVIIKNVILHGTYNTTARVDLTNEGDEDDPFLTVLADSPTTTSYSLFTSYLCNNGMSPTRKSPVRDAFARFTVQQNLCMSFCVVVFVPLSPSFPPFSKTQKLFSTFFQKGVDKPSRLWYNTCVIQRQQVPVKADAFLPRR